MRRRTGTARSTLRGPTSAVFDLHGVSLLDRAGLAKLMFLHEGLDLVRVPAPMVRATPAVRRGAKVAGGESFLPRSRPEGLAT